MKRDTLATLTAALFLLLFSGCANVDPNARAEVVRAEQTIDVSVVAVDEFLRAEHDTRPGGELTEFANDLRETFPPLVRQTRAGLKLYKHTGEGLPTAGIDQIAAIARLARQRLAEMHR